MLSSGEVLGFCYILPENLTWMFTQVSFGGRSKKRVALETPMIPCGGKEKVEELSEKRCQVGMMRSPVRHREDR